MVERAGPGLAADGGYRTDHPLGGEKLTEVVTIRITLAHYRGLSGMADRANTDRASILRNLLEAALRR